MGRVLRGRGTIQVLIFSVQKRLPVGTPTRCARGRFRPYQIYIPPKQFSFRRKAMSQQLESPKGAMSVDDFALWAGIGRTTAWKEIRDGQLRAVKVSARTIIRFADAETWLATRPPLAVQSAQLSLTSK